MNKKLKYLSLIIASISIAGFIGLNSTEKSDEEKLNNFTKTISDVDLKGDFKDVLDNPDFDNRAVSALQQNFMMNKNKKNFTISSGEVLNKIYKTLPNQIKENITEGTFGSTVMNLNRYSITSILNTPESSSGMYKFSSNIFIDKNSAEFDLSIEFENSANKNINEKISEILSILNIDNSCLKKISQEKSNNITLYENNQSNELLTFNPNPELNTISINYKKIELFE